jgi:hypothetical protein
MSKSKMRWATVALLVGVLLTATLAPAAAAVPLTPAEKTALNQAIAEEYLAYNTYRAVLVQYPGAIPFRNIVLSEQQHVSTLAGLFTKYGLPVPPNPGLSPAPTWTSLKAACQTGVDVEKDDIALYNNLLPTVQKADVIRVFTNLRSASLYNHLPAFDACN